MKIRTRTGMLVAAVVGATIATACRATVPVGDPDTWSQRAELDVGQRGIFDAGAIEVVVTEVGDAHAMIAVELDGVSSQGRVTTDPRGYVTVPPYQVHLVAAENDRSAVIEVRRPR